MANVLFGFFFLAFVWPSFIILGLLLKIFGDEYWKNTMLMAVIIVGGLAYGTYEFARYMSWVDIAWMQVYGSLLGTITTGSFIVFNKRAREAISDARKQNRE